MLGAGGVHSSKVSRTHYSWSWTQGFQCAGIGRLSCLHIWIDTTVLVILPNPIYSLIGNYMEVLKSTTNVESLDKETITWNETGQSGILKDSLQPVNVIDWPLIGCALPFLFSSIHLWQYANRALDHLFHWKFCKTTVTRDKRANQWKHLFLIYLAFFY